MHSIEIQQWWEEVLRSLVPNEAQKHLRIDTATEAQTRLARYEARFQKAWGILSCEVLQSKYNPASGFKKKTLQSLVQFAERSLFENGQAALEEALRLRLQFDDDRPYRTREPYIVPSDVKKAQELYNSHHHHNGAIENEQVTTQRKRKRVAEEDRAFSGKYQAESILSPTASTGGGMNAETGAEHAIGRDVELEMEGTQASPYEDDRTRPYHQATDKTAQVPLSFGNDRVRQHSEESNKRTEAPPYGFDRVHSHHQETDKTAHTPPSYGNDRFRPPSRESTKGTEAPPYGFDRFPSHHEETDKMAEAPLSYGNDGFHHPSEESNKGIEAPPSYGDDSLRHRSEESDKGTQATPNRGDRIRYQFEESEKGTQAPADGDDGVRHHSKDINKGPQATPSRGDEVRHLSTVSVSMHD